MKLLKENYGESEELNTFVSQSDRRFNKYYEVELMLNNSSKSRRYFAYEEAAQEYYDGLVKEANDNKEYYDGANIQLSEVIVNKDYNELQSTIIGTDNDDFDDDIIVDEEPEEFNEEEPIEEN